VTTRWRAWRVAAAPAHSSMSRMISPPCTLPDGFASLGSIVFEKTVFDADTGLGVMTMGRRVWHLSGGPPSIRAQ
jgi:hypothetical protein